MNTAITDLLQDKSMIKGTPFEDLVNNTIGYFLELIEEDTVMMNDGCFLDTAEGKYLDLWGKDYGINRLPDESDDDYRIRLSILPLQRFTIDTLYELYDVQLLTYKSGADDLTLLSDNHFLADKYFVDIDDNVWQDIVGKFLASGILYRWNNG